VPTLWRRVQRRRVRVAMDLRVMKDADAWNEMAEQKVLVVVEDEI